VSDLTEALGMEQSAVSRQLRVLREHNLVRAEGVQIPAEKMAPPMKTSRE
jgi:DNA-binding transcriptional ArsR family regulator